MADPFGRVSNFVDGCSDGFLIEYFCLTNGSISNEHYRCANGCSNGACNITIPPRVGRRSLSVAIIQPRDGEGVGAGIVTVVAQGSHTGLSQDSYPIQLFTVANGLPVPAKLVIDQNISGPPTSGSCGGGPNQPISCSWTQRWNWDASQFAGQRVKLYVNVSGEGLSAENSILVNVAEAGIGGPQCILTGASWNQTTASIGSQIILAVTGQNCDGKSLSYEVREADTFSADDPVRINPKTAKFVNGVAKSTWIVESQADEFASRPEYYFIARLEGTKQDIKSALLQVI